MYTAIVRAARAVLCTDLSALVGTAVATYCYYALVVGELCHELVPDEWQRETGSRVKLYGQRRNYRRWFAVPDSTDLRASAPLPSLKASKA